MSTDYKNFVPVKAIPFVQFLIDEHSFDLIIVNQRQTKHGDFRKLPDGRFQITVNNNLNKYQFLLTLVHEIAHHVTHQKFGRVRPHGKEWKAIMHAFGADASVTANYDLTGIPLKNRTLFTYRCGCRDHQLGIIRHNRIKKNKNDFQ